MGFHEVVEDYEFSLSQISIELMSLEKEIARLEESNDQSVPVRYGGFKETVLVDRVAAILALKDALDKRREEYGSITELHREAVEKYELAVERYCSKKGLDYGK